VAVEIVVFAFVRGANGAAVRAGVGRYGHGSEGSAWH
jgi:hypothetical protein